MTTPGVLLKDRKTLSENSGWEVLPYLSYSPDPAPSGSHMTRSMQVGITEIRLTSKQGAINTLDSFLIQAGALLFRWNP